MNFQEKIRNFLGGIAKPAQNFFQGTPVHSPIPTPTPQRQGGFLNTLSNSFNDNQGFVRQNRVSFGAPVNNAIRTVVKPISSYINKPFDTLGARSSELMPSSGTGDYRQRVLNTFPKAAGIVGEEFVGGLLGNSRPARAVGRFTGGFTGAVGQAPVQLGVGMSQMVNKNGYGNVQNQGMRNIASGGAKSLLTAIGANRLGIGTGLVGGGIGAGVAGLTGGDLAEGAGQGFGETVNTLGLTKFTDPVIFGASGFMKARYANPITQQIVGRALTGAGNVLEDEILAKVDGIQTGLADKMLSFAIGSAVSGGGSIKDWDDLKKQMTQGLDMLSAKRVEQVIEVAKSTGKQPRDLFGRFMQQGKEQAEKTKGQFMGDFRKQAGYKQPLGESAYGAVAGLEPYQDEDGNWKYRYNATKGAIGVGGLLIGKSATGYKQAPNKFSSLADKKPRFEIDDSKAQMKPIDNKKISSQLKDVIDHPELFKNYPELKNLYVARGKSSFYSPQMNMIKINKTAFPVSDLEKVYNNLENSLVKEAQSLQKKGKLNQEFEDYASKKLAELGKQIKEADKNGKQFIYDKSTLLHEIQHAIQEIEGFAKGGSIETFTAGGRINPKTGQQFTIEEGIDGYKRLSGEIEARDVQSRMDLTPEQRRTTQPYASQGIPLKDQIVRFDSGVSANKPSWEEFYNQNKSNIDIEVNKVREQASSIPDPKNRNKYFQEEIRQIKNRWVEKYSKLNSNIMAFTNTPTYKNSIESALQSAKSAEESAQIVKQQVDNIISTAKNENDIKAVRASLNQFINESVATSGEWKKDYYLKNAQVFGDPQNLHLKAAAEQIDRIDEMLSKEFKKLPNLKTNVTLTPEQQAAKAKLPNIMYEGIENATKNSTPLSQVQPADKMKLGKLGYDLKEIETMPPYQRRLILDKNAPKDKYAFNSKVVTDKEFNQINKEADSFIREQYNLKTPKQYSTQQVSQVNAQSRANAKLDKKAQPSLEQDYGLLSNKGRGDLEVPPEVFANAKSWKDKGMFMLNRETPIRNIEEVAGKDAPAVKKFFFNKVQENEQAAANWIAETKKTIKEEVIGNLGIAPNSNEDRYTMAFGEGRMSLEELKKATPKWENVVKADKYFRTFYEDTLKRVNEVITKFGYEPVKRRKNYYTHYQELGDVFDKLGTILNSDVLPRDINGLTADFKPGKQFFQFAQPRLGGQFKESAIGAVDTYLEPASRQIFHTDSVQRGRAMEKVIGEALRKNENVNPTHLSNFFAWLRDYNNTLAGKKSLMARGSEGLFGRKVYGVVNFLRSQTGANQIGGNVSAAITNTIPAFTQAPATMDKGSYIKGLTKALISPLSSKNNYEIDGVQSSFLRRRFKEDKLAPTKLDNIRMKAGGMFEAIDRFTSTTVVSGKYYEGLKKRLKPEVAMKRADDYAARMMGDRSFGQTPQLFQNQGLAGLVTQYQLEVNNQLSFLFKDIPRNSPNKAQLISRISQVLLYSYMYNSAFEYATGRRPAFDPLGVIQDAYEDYSDEDMDRSKANMNLIENVSNQLPFSSTITGGGRVPLSAGIPDVKGIIEGKKDPTKEFMKPIYYYASPVGGGQSKKTIEGLYDYSKGYTETPSGNVRFPIKQNVQNLVRTTLFGTSSTPEAKEYYRKGKTSFSEKESEKFKSLSPQDREIFATTRDQKDRIAKQKKLAKEQIMTQGFVDDPFKSDTKSIKKLVSTDVKQESIQKAGLENPFKNLFNKDEKKTSDVDSLVSLYELEKYVADEPADPLKKAVFAKDKLSKANEIYKDEEIEEGDKQKIIEKLGFNQDDIRYNVATNLDVDERAVYIAERMKGMDDKRKAQFLEDTRTKSLGGKYLGTKDVYDNLIDAGLIDKQTKDYLLSFEKELDTQSRQYKSTKTGSGKGKKKAIKNVSFEKSLKTGKTKTLKLKVPKISSYIPKDASIGTSLRARERKKLTFKGQPLKIKV